MEQLSCGLTTRRGKHRGWVLCRPGGGPGRGPRWANRRQHWLALGTWIFISLGGKDPELVRKVERYQLDIVGLTSTQNTGSSGTRLLEKGWTLPISGVAHFWSCPGWEAPGGSRDTHEPLAERCCVGFFLGEWEGRLHVPTGSKVLLFVLMHQTAVRSIQPFWSRWLPTP